MRIMLIFLSPDKLDLNEGNVDRSVKTVYRFDKEDEEEGKFWPR